MKWDESSLAATNNRVFFRLWSKVQLCGQKASQTPSAVRCQYAAARRAGRRPAWPGVRDKTLRNKTNETIQWLKCKDTSLSVHFCVPTVAFDKRSSGEGRVKVKVVKLPLVLEQTRCSSGPVACVLLGQRGCAVPVHEQHGHPARWPSVSVLFNTFHSESYVFHWLSQRRSITLGSFVIIREYCFTTIFTPFEDA